MDFDPTKHSQYELLAEARRLRSEYLHGMIRNGWRRLFSRKANGGIAPVPA